MMTLPTKEEEYKGREIWTMGRGYTVYYHGDEIFFYTIEGAREFIDELTEED